MSGPTQPKPFTCDADTLHCLLSILIDDTAPHHAGRVFRARAKTLSGALASVLVWMRDHKGVPIDLAQIEFTARLHNLRALVEQRRFRVHKGDTCAVSEIAVEDMPEPLAQPLRDYLGHLPGYDASLPAHGRPVEQPTNEHGFVLTYLVRACSYGAPPLLPAWT